MKWLLITFFLLFYYLGLCQLIDIHDYPSIEYKKGIILTIKKDNIIAISSFCNDCTDYDRKKIEAISNLTLKVGDKELDSVLYNREWNIVDIIDEVGNLDNLFLFEQLTFLRFLNIQLLAQKSKSIFEDSLHPIWQLPKIEWVKERTRVQNSKYEFFYLYRKKDSILILKGAPHSLSCEKFQKIFFLDKVKKLYIEDNVLPDSCWCNLKNLEAIGIHRIDYSSGKILPYISNLSKLNYIDIYGGWIPRDSLRKKEKEKFAFDAWQIIQLDTLNVERLGLKPKIKDIQLDSIKYLNLGQGNYPQSYASRLRHKLRGANVQLWQEDNWAKDLMRTGYDTDIGHLKEKIWSIKHIVLDICYLPVQSMRISLGIQNFYNRKTDKYGTSYTGGTHIFNLNVGTIITPQLSTKIMAETRYDYLLPRFPIFFGLGFNAYVDVITGDFRAYARPRIGLTFALLSIWYSHGVPLAPTYMENVPPYEIGLSIALYPAYFLPRQDGFPSVGW